MSAARKTSSPRASSPSPVAVSPHTVNPPAPAPTPSQQLHNAFEDALEQGNLALDQTKNPGQRDTLNQLLDALSSELTALNRLSIEDNTVALQAAAQQLGDGMDKLVHLKEQIDQVADTMANAAKVVTAVDGVLSGLKSFLAAFPL